MKTEINIPKLRFREFNGGWKEEKLGDISKIGDGLHGTPKYSDNGEFAFINGNNLRKNTIFIDSSNKYVQESELTSIDKNLNQNTLLISLNGTIGNVSIYNDEKIKLSKSTGYINLYNVNRIFMLYKLSTNNLKNFFVKNITGTTIKNLSLLTLKNTNIKITSSLEQQKIGSFFEKIDKIIELQTQKLEQLKKLKQGYLQKMFPQDGKSVPRLRFNEFSGEWEKQGLLNLAKLRTGSRNAEDGINNGKFVFFDRSSEIKFLNEYDFDGEVIVYAGEGAKFLPRKFNGKYSLHQRAYGIYDFKNINFEFLYQELINKNNHFLKYAVGTTAKSLRKDCFEKLVIMYPSSEEQEKIESFLFKLDQLINSQSKKIEALKQQKKAYLQKMFI